MFSETAEQCIKASKNIHCIDESSQKGSDDMKKLGVILLAALMIALAGCAQNQAGDKPSVEGKGSPAAESQLQVVADTTLYRGTVTAVSDHQLTVEQHDGRNYGEPEIIFTLPDSGATGFRKGDYVEIYYGDLRETAPAQAEAILAEKLADKVEEVVTNGTVQEVLEGENGVIADLLLIDSNGQEILFHISEETQIYMDKEALIPGEKISVLHDDVFTLSLPPQGNAREISPWRYQREIADTQVTE